MDSIWVLPILFTPAVLGLIGFWIIEKRRNKAEMWLPDFEQRKTLSTRDRSDIYRDMAWWDREFRKLCGEPEPTSQLSDSMNQVIGALRNFGLVPTVEEIKPANNITYLYDPEKDYQAEMKKVLND